MDYNSAVTIDARSHAGVRFTVAKMSLGRRIELTRRIAEVSRKAEFLEAGATAGDEVEAAALAGEVDRLYLRWGLLGLEGMTLDGEPATAETLAERGPEDLCREMVAAIKAECGLSGEERKN